MKGIGIVAACARLNPTPGAAHRRRGPRDGAPLVERRVAGSFDGELGAQFSLGSREAEGVVAEDGAHVHALRDLLQLAWNVPAEEERPGCRDLG